MFWFQGVDKGNAYHGCMYVAEYDVHSSRPGLAEKQWQASWIGKGGTGGAAGATVLEPGATSKVQARPDVDASETGLRHWLQPVACDADDANDARPWQTDVQTCRHAAGQTGRRPCADAASRVPHQTLSKRLDMRCDRVKT